MLFTLTPANRKNLWNQNRSEKGGVEEQQCLCLEDIKSQNYSKQEVVGRHCMHVTKKGF